MLKIDFWNIAFILINLLVWYWFVKRFLFGPISAVIEKRRETVEQDLDAAKQSREEAQVLKEQYEASIADAKQEAAQILEQARVRAGEQYEETMQKARQDAEQKLAEAQKNIALEREKSMHELETQISSLAMDAAEKILLTQHSKEQDRQMYELFLEKAGEKHE